MVQMLTITDTAHRAAGAVSSAAGTLWGGAKSAGSTVWNAVSTIFSDYIAPAANWAGRKILAGGRVSLAAAKAHPYITLTFVAGAGLAIAYKKGYLTSEKNSFLLKNTSKIDLSSYVVAIHRLFTMKVMSGSDVVPVISEENKDKIEKVLTHIQDTSLDEMKKQVLTIMTDNKLTSDQAKAKELNRVASNWPAEIEAKEDN